MKEQFAEKRTLLEIVNVFTAIANNADEYIESRYATSQVECKVGCNYCCYMRVAATPIELFSLAIALSVSRSKSEMATLIGKLVENLKKTQNLSTIDHYKAKIPCSLLGEDGKCTAYDHRPLACRQWLSASKSKCERGFRSPEDEPTTLFLGTSMAWGLGLSAGMHEYLESQNIDGAPYELNFGLLRILTTPNLLGKWLQGEKVFVKYDIEK